MSDDVPLSSGHDSGSINAAAGPVQSSNLRRALNSLGDADRSTRMTGLRILKEQLYALHLSHDAAEHYEAWVRAEACIPALTSALSDSAEGVREGAAQLLALVSQAAVAHDVKLAGGQSAAAPQPGGPSRTAILAGPLLVAASDRLGSTPPLEGTEEVRRALLRAVRCLLALPSAPPALASVLASRVGELGKVLEHAALDAFPEAKMLATDAALLACRPGMGLRLHLHAVMGRVCGALAACCGHQRAAVRAAGARALGSCLPLCGEARSKIAVEVVLPALVKMEGDRSVGARLELARTAAELLLGLGPGPLGLAGAVAPAAGGASDRVTGGAGAGAAGAVDGGASRAAERSVPLRLLALLLCLTQDPSPEVAALGRSRAEGVASAWAAETGACVSEGGACSSGPAAIELPFPFCGVAGPNPSASGTSASTVEGKEAVDSAQQQQQQQQQARCGPPSAALGALVGAACRQLVRQAASGATSWQADQRASGARLLRVLVAVSGYTALAGCAGVVWDVLEGVADRAGEVEVGPLLRDAGALLGARCGEWVLLERACPLIEGQARGGRKEEASESKGAAAGVSGDGRVVPIAQRGRAIRAAGWVLDGMGGRQAAPVLPALAGALGSAGLLEGGEERGAGDGGPVVGMGAAVVGGALAVIRAGEAGGREDPVERPAAAGESRAAESGTGADAEPSAEGAVSYGKSSAAGKQAPVEKAWASAETFAAAYAGGSDTGTDLDHLAKGSPLAAAAVRLPLCRALLPLLRPSLPHPGARGGEAEGPLAVARGAAVCICRLAHAGAGAGGGATGGSAIPDGREACASLIHDSAEGVVKAAERDAATDGWSPRSSTFRGLAALLRTAPEAVARPGAGSARPTAIVRIALHALRPTRPSALRGAMLALLFDVGDALAQAQQQRAKVVTRSQAGHPVMADPAAGKAPPADTAGSSASPAASAHEDARLAAIAALAHLRGRDAAADAAGAAAGAGAGDSGKGKAGEGPAGAGGGAGAADVSRGDVHAGAGASFGRWLGGQPLLLPPTLVTADRAAVALVPGALALLRDGLAPAAAWRPGAEAATLRRLALTAALRLVEAGILGPAGREPLRAALGLGLNRVWPGWTPRDQRSGKVNREEEEKMEVKEDDAGRLFPGSEGGVGLQGHQAGAACAGVLLKAAGSALDDEDGRTRKAAVRLMAAVLRAAAAAGVRLTDEGVRSVCHPLLQRLDDAHDELRVDGACAAALLLRLARPSAIRGQPVELTADTLALHADDPDREVQAACELGLRTAARADPEYVRKVCAEHRARHRSPDLCDRVAAYAESLLDSK